MEKRIKLLASIKAILDGSFDAAEIKGVVPMMDTSSTETVRCLPQEQCLPMAMLCAKIVLTVKTKPKERDEHPYVTWARKCKNNMAWMSYFGYYCCKRFEESETIATHDEEIMTMFYKLKDLLYKNYSLFDSKKEYTNDVGIVIEMKESKTSFPNDTPSDVAPGISLHGWNTKAIWLRWYAENVFNEFSHSIQSISKYDGARTAFHDNGKMFEPA